MKTNLANEEKSMLWYSLISKIPSLQERTLKGWIVLKLQMVTKKGRVILCIINYHKKSTFSGNPETCGFSG